MSEECPDTVCCIHCSMALKKTDMKKVLTLPVEIQSMLQHPELITDEDYLCPTCIATLKAGGIGEDCCQCAGCSCSMCEKKTHAVALSCPQRAVIESWLCPDHANLKFTRVCDACWSAACEEVEAAALKTIAKTLEKKSAQTEGCVEKLQEILADSIAKSQEEDESAYTLDAELAEPGPPMELVS